MAYWWNKTKKLSKEELIEKGKELTKKLSIVVIACCITCFFSVFFFNLFPVFLFSCFALLVGHDYLVNYKREFYARFCK